MHQLKVNQQHTIAALYRQGWSKRRIARELGLDRSTVRRYVGLAQHDDFISEDLLILGSGHFSHHVIRHVVFGACDPGNAALIEIAQMREVHVTLVKQDDFTALDPGAQFPRTLVEIGRASCRERV